MRIQLEQDDPIWRDITQQPARHIKMLINSYARDKKPPSAIQRHWRLSTHRHTWLELDTLEQELGIQLSGKLSSGATSGAATVPANGTNMVSAEGPTAVPPRGPT